MSQENVNIPLFSVSGTRDFFPEEKLVQEWLFSKWKEASLLYGCQQYDAPILEHTSLWKRKAGDDVTREMYSFKTRDGIEVCLRPEMTPSVSRMVIKRLHNDILPLKWFSIPQCWRYETTSKGRKREHYQWNVDIFGAKKVKSEGELFAIIVYFLKSIGLTSDDISLKVSNRMILQKVLEKNGVKGDDVIVAFNIIDKLNKWTREELSNMLKDKVNMTQEGIDTIFKLVTVKDVEDLTAFLDPKDDTVQELRKLFSLATAYGYREWLTFDVSIVRGLSYYTGTVFEGFFKNTELQRSVCGGGRYDNLLEKYGYHETVPAVGFGFGDVVILEVLKELDRLPKLKYQCDYCVISFNEELFPNASSISERLREKGKVTNLYMETDKRMKNAFSYADRTGAKNVIFVAPEEMQRNEIVIKNLRETDKSKKQITIGIDEFINSLS